MDSARVWILGRNRSRSQYFKLEPEQEPESTLRSVQESIKHTKVSTKVSLMMLVVVGQN